MPLKVTFDTSVLDHVVKPEQQAGEAVRVALSEGRIKGFISEAVVALDVFGRDEKVEMVGHGRMFSQSQAIGPHEIDTSIGSKWTRPALHPKGDERLQAAFAIGLKMLIGPRRLGDILPPAAEYHKHYEHYPSHSDLLVRSAATNDVDGALCSRGLGRAKVVALGLDFSEKAGANGEWWPQGLGKARTKAERKRAHKAIAEWADGDAIAAHVGYGNDLFCTHDLASSSGKQSVLHPDNRAWLRKQYGVQFVTLSDLVARVRGG